MFDFNQPLNLPNKKFDVFTIGELLVDMISNDYNVRWKICYFICRW